MLDLAPCTKTISLLESMIFGADGACVSMSAGSVMVALIPFVVVVVLLQILANRIVARMRNKRCEGAQDDDPIRSDRRM